MFQTANLLVIIVGYTHSFPIIVGNVSINRKRFRRNPIHKPMIHLGTRLEVFDNRQITRTAIEHYMVSVGIAGGDLTPTAVVKVVMRSRGLT